MAEIHASEQRGSAQVAPDVDVVVVGAGIAGLMTAARLAATGASCCVLEASTFGGGATTANHGILHSGALMALLHPHLTQVCTEAQREFRSSFSDCFRPTDGALYFGQPSQLQKFRAQWDNLGLWYERVDRSELPRYVRADSLALAGARVADAVVDTPAIIDTLVASCTSLGVELVTQAQVRNLTALPKGVRVGLGRHEEICALQVVLAAGVGSQSLLVSFESRLLNQIRMRRVALMARLNAGLTEALMCVDFGGPTVIPHGDVVVVGQYGGPQPWTTSRSRRSSVDSTLLDAIQSSLEHYCRPGMLMRAEPELAWEGVKVEVETGRADAWGTEPSFSITDHGVLDGIAGVWSIVPGKMSLAFHATQALVQQMGHAFEPLALPATDGRVTPASAPTPWEALLAEDDQKGRGGA